MADQITTDPIENEEISAEDVETPTGDDEPTGEEDQDQGGEGAGANDEEELDEDGNPKTPEDPATKFQKRFSQFKGETPEDYIKNLEDGYANSSTEAQRLTQEAKKATEKVDKVAQFIATHPDFAKAFNEATGEDAPKVVRDPALDYAKQQMEKEYATDYKAFVGTHPEMDSDETIRQQVIDEMDVIASAYEKRGVTLSMADGLKKAWISLGLDETEDKDNVVNKTKQQASKPQAPAGKKPSTEKPSFTPDQIATAKKMGITVEQLAKYSK